MGFDGFDSIDVVTGVEDRLDLSISDRDAERLRTPAELVDYLASRLPSALGQDVRCRSAAAFRSGRHHLDGFNGVPASAIRPSTSIQCLLPPPTNAADRRAAWSRLADSIEVRLPHLNHAVVYTRLLLAGLFATWAVLAFVAVLRPAESRPTVVGMAGLATLAYYVFAAAFLVATRRRLGTEVPAGFETVADVTSLQALHTIPDAPASPAGWTRHELWELVRDLTARSAACSPGHVKPDTRWGAL